MARRVFNVRWILGLLVVGGLVAVAVWPRAVEIEVGTITKGPLVVTIDEDGTTRVRDRFIVTSPVGGEVLRIQLKAGDRVRKGETLAVVRPAAPVPLDARSRAEGAALVLSASDALRRAEAERNRAATVADRAKRSRDLAQSLFKGGAVARDEVDAREAEWRTTEAVVQSAEFAVAQASHDVEVARARVEPQTAGAPARDVVITSPVDGVVLKQNRESQAVVPPGDPLLEIGDPSRLEILADLLSADAVRVKPGSEVLIEQWGGPETLHGRVRRIEPSGFTKISALGVEEQRVNVVIDFDAPAGTAAREVGAAPGQLGAPGLQAGGRELGAGELGAPGLQTGGPETRGPALGDHFRVEVRIVTWQADNVLKAPPGALFRQGDAWAAYLIADGRAHLRPVQVGQRSEKEVQLLGGLDEGAQVVLYPPDTLVDGAKVAPRR